MNDVKILGYGSMLIESLTDETEEGFRSYVTGLLGEIYGHLPDWLVFRVGRRFERQGQYFREFLCRAGSVDGRIRCAPNNPEVFHAQLSFAGHALTHPFVLRFVPVSKQSLAVTSCG